MSCRNRAPCCKAFLGGQAFEVRLQSSRPEAFPAVMPADSWIPVDSDDSGDDDPIAEAEALIAESDAEQPPSIQPPRQQSQLPKLPTATLASSDCRSAAAPGATATRRARSSQAECKLVAAKGKGSSQRRLVRRSSVPTSTSCRSMLCVFGKPMTMPQAVWPLTKSPDGKEWFAVSEHSIWLRKACTRTGMTRYDLAFQSAISELRRTLKVQVEKLLDKGATEQLKMRQELQLDDIEQEPSPAASKKRKKDVTDPVRVELDGSSILVQPQTAPLLIEATTDAVTSVVEFVKSHISVGKITLQRDSRKKQDGDGDACAMPEPTCHRILGKVTWHPSRTAWCIHYKDATGQTMQKRIPVQVILGPCGATGDSFATAREKAYYEAIRQWNAEDKSSRDRILVETSS